MKRLFVALVLLALPCAASAQQTNMYWQTSGTAPCPSCWSPVSAANPLPVSIGGSSGGVAVFGPTASGSASANPPVQIGGTVTGAAGQNVAGAAVKPASTAAASTDTSLVTQLNPSSPGIIANAAPGTPNTATVISVQGETGMTPVTTNFSGYTYTHITTAATTTPKSSAGVLHTICINSLGTVASSVTVDDAASATTPTIAVINSLALLGCQTYDVAFTVGLTLVTTGTVAPDVTVSWR
jgi:hypothetical protein